MFRVRPLTDEDARTIVRWRYEEPYAFYNAGSDLREEELEMLTGAYHAAVDSAGLLAGFFCFGLPAQVPGGHTRGVYKDTDLVDIGLGMRPELTGKGLGLEFVRAGCLFAIETFAPRGLRLVVATFNVRAIRVYERAGFLPVTVFPSQTSRGEVDFLLMTLVLPP